MAGQLRVDEITNEAGTGSPSFPNGVAASTATTAGSITGTTTAAVPTSALGSGTASGTTFLAGDRTFKTVGGTDVQTFNSNGTWTKPSTGSMARIQVWSGGGGGSRNSSNEAIVGGGGGGYGEIVVPLSSLGATVSVTIGAGGAGRTGSAGNGTNGGSSSFGSVISVFGGLGGNNTEGEGSGGGLIDPANYRRYEKIIPQVFDGGSGQPNQNSIGQKNPSQRGSIYGGGGGGASANTGNGCNIGGFSYFAGNGGNSGQNGTAPSGGGGGGSSTTGNGGSGAAGRVVVTVW
jgi:hypothetical protein